MWGGDWDAKRDAAQAAKWAKTCRELQRDALELADKMTNPDAKAAMLSLADRYGRLAERAELRRDQLALLAGNKRH
jgi:hypothetical protein